MAAEAREARGAAMLLVTAASRKITVRFIVM
jgi:hypothetical protein